MIFSNLYISKIDLINTLQFIYDVSQLDQLPLLSQKITEIKQLVPVEYFLAGVYNKKNPQIDHTISFNIPSFWIDKYNKNFIHIDPLIDIAIHKNKLYSWSLEICGNLIGNNHNELISELNELNMKGGIFLSDTLNESQYSYFSFIGRELINHAEHQQTIKILFFCIHAAYRKLLEISGQPKFSLSKKEIEILQWLKTGKTNWEISIILSISERTVKFHLSNIFRKLNVNNRVGAIATAIVNNIVY